MEAVSDEEAKSLASHWVKRIESSILGQIDESVVKASFNSDGDLHFAKQDSYRDEVNRRVRGCYRTTNECPLNYNKSNVNGFLKERACDHHNYRSEFELTCGQSNSADFKTVKEPDERMIVQNQPLCSGRYTPRVDIDFIRQKRLAFFDVEHNPTRGSSDSVQLNTYSNVVHKQATNSKPTCDVNSVFTTEPYDIDLPGNSISLQHNSSDSVLHSKWLNASLSPTLNSQCKGENQFFRHYASFGETKEEDDIRLELWGLKDAVNSGELDLKLYLQEPTQKGHEPTIGRPKQMLSNSFHESKYSHPVENEGQIFRMDLPVRELKHVDLFDDKSKSKAHQTNSSNSRNLQFTDSSDQYSNSSGPTYQVYSSEHFNTSLSKSHLEGNENINSCFHAPKPQIYGPLYSGFENSDSDSSLLSFGSTCKEVNYRKVVKKRDVSDNKKSSSVQEKHENRSTGRKRGKEKILLELTHFIEGAEFPRGEQGLNQTTDDILADKCFKENNTSFQAETLTSQSCVDVGGVGNINTQGNCDLHLMNEPCKTGHSLSCNYIEPNDQSSEISGKALGKTCPECMELNSSTANWCIECGTALVSVKPICLTSQQQKCWKEKRSQTQAIIRDTIRREDIVAEKEAKQLHNEISSLSLQASHSSTELGALKHSGLSGYSRRWRRSSTAWSSFNPGELSKSSSCLVERSKAKRKKKCTVGTGAEEPMRARSASELPNGYTSTKDTADGNGRKTTWVKPARQRASSCNLSGCSAGEVFSTLEGVIKSKSCDHPQSADYSSRCSLGEKDDITTAFVKRPSGEHAVLHQQTVQDMPQCNSTGHLLKSSSSSFCVDEVRQLTSQATKPFVPPLNLQDVDSYDRILTLIRTWRESEPVSYLYLPDEILLKIFSFMRQKDLSACSRVCWQFYRISMDESLWKTIVIKKNRNITDEWLCAIGKHRPVSLTMSQCHGNKVTTKGLRELFRSCSDTLEELNFSGCRGGELIGESILLHVAARCRWLRSVDASWSNVGDTGVQALVDNVESLQCLCLNGCPAITDESIKCVANKHGTTLRIFEVFGCFNITPAGIKILGYSCKNLQTLNIGQCHKITDSAIGSLVSNLSELENLDLRGCKQARDSAVKKIVRYCPLVINLVLANCPYITDVSLAEIATNIPKIRSLDICGCAKVSDNGIRALSKGCRQLELLDLTSTGVSHKSVLSLANYCSQSLCNLKLSFCSDISDHTVAHLARHCKRLTTLHLYGCKRIRNASALRSLNPALTIEC